MCKAADAAKLFVNHAIELAQSTNCEDYYADYYKLHQLLYFAQRWMYTECGKQLFEEDIELRDGIPFIKALQDLPLSFSPIKQCFSDYDIAPLTRDRIDAIDSVLNEIGRLSKDALIRLAVIDIDSLKEHGLKVDLSVPHCLPREFLEIPSLNLTVHD